MNGAARTPFLVFPWDRRFLPLLLDRALTMCGGDPGRALFVFPHARPARYMLELIREHAAIAKPCLLPEMLPVSSFFSAVREASGIRPGLAAGMLDQVALLLECVRKLAVRGDFPPDQGLFEGTDYPGDSLPLDDPKRFFPWGMRLAALMEEFFSHNVTPSDYAHTEGEVTPFASALLSRLAGIHALYLDALTERGWTTPGLDARIAARHADAAVELAGGRQVFLAGFHTLNGCENIVFRRLWENGATVCLHADPLVADGSTGGAHWSCRTFIRWAQSWRARIEADPSCSRPGSHPGAHPGAHPDEKEQSLRFVAGFDLHSQLTELEKDLALPGVSKNAEGDGNAPCDGTGNGTGNGIGATRHAYESTAVVLPEASLLMPVLHHLPDTDVNISMGYPLSRSPLFRLLESVMEAQERAAPREKEPGSGEPGASGKSLYHWKAAVALIRHPYLKMLEPAPDSVNTEGDMPGSASGNAQDKTGRNAAAPDGPTLRRLLHRLEEKLRAGRRYADPSAMAGEILAENAAESPGLPGPPDMALAALFEALIATVFSGWEDVRSPASLAAALERTVSLLLRHGSSLWERFPVDAECLYRLMQSVIPQLAFCALRDEPLDRSVLFLVLRRLLASERAPFEADPLVGLQVMGVLETRLLSFDRLFLLDATEDRIPGSPSQDPLLPDSLRGLAGLPDARGREHVAAYNFFRLVRGARECVIYWQEGVEPQGLSDGKKLRSRFVEELIWREEEKRREILAPEKHGGEHGPLRRLHCALPPLPLERRTITAGPEARERMRAILSAGISPSLLDAWLLCPARFFHERIGGLRQIEDINEKDDPRELGNLLHTVLQEYFSSRLGRPVAADAESGRALIRRFRAALGASPLSLTLPADSLIMLEEAGPERLMRLLAAQEGSVPIRLEDKLEAPFYVRGKSRLLKGVLDRVDERDGETLILDYKTGSPKRPVTEFWLDEGLWEAVEDFLALGKDEVPGNDGIISEIAGRAGSVQLPSYLHLFAHGAGCLADNAAYVTLGDAAEELFLFSGKNREKAREAAVDRIPLLLAAIARHMEDCAVYRPRPGLHCDWCSCKNSCIVLCSA